MARPIVCWVRAKDEEEAQQCAWDVAWSPERKAEAHDYPEIADPSECEMYRVTIKATKWAPNRKSKSSKKGAKRS